MSVASSARPSAWHMPAALRASVGLHVMAGGIALAAPQTLPWAAALLVANHAALTAAGLWPRSRMLGPNLTRLPADARARREVAVTIDDGPDPEVTPALLDLLDKHRARVTFFCIAERAAAAPALTREIVARGHSVQNHSMRHKHSFAMLGPRGFRRELTRAQAVLSDITGVMPTCFRAPAGLRNPFLDPVLHELDLHLVSWTRRGFDTRQADPARVLARLELSLAPGDILLLHDGHAARAASGRPVLLEVVPPLLGRFAAASLKLVTLPQAMTPRADGGGA